MKHIKKVIHCMSRPIKSAKSQTVNWKNIYTQAWSIDMLFGVV